MTTRERTVAGALIAAILGAVLFIVAYATGGDRLAEGMSLALAAAGLCAAACGYAFWLIPPQTVTDHREEWELRDSAASDSQCHPELVEGPSRARRGPQSLPRHKALTALLYAAAGAFATALLLPLRSLGTSSFADALPHSKWRKGTRLIRENGSLVHANDLDVDSFLTVFPEGAAGDPMSQTMLLRAPDDAAPQARGFIAYSKICTHAGCPVALYRSKAKQLMCPCHQSVFDVLNNGSVVSGPADHALPRLPLEIDAEGYVCAVGDFIGDLGPSFWQRNG